jgi:hypothetical protein
MQPGSQGPPSPPETLAAYDQVPDKVDLDFYYAVRARSYLLDDQFELALCMTRERMAYNQSINSENVYLAYAELALIHAILGNNEALYFDTIAGKGDRFRDEREEMYFYLRKIALADSLGVTFSALKEWKTRMSSWAREHGNLELPRLLMMATETRERSFDHEFDCRSQSYLS